MGNKRAALIDTGLGISNLYKVVRSLTGLPILVITTHVHWDHIGGHKYFENFAVHEKDVPWIKEKFPLPTEVIKSEVLKYDCKFPKSFDIKNYKIFKGNPSIVLQDNDIIDLGNRFLKIIHTPGHSPGHVCVFEEETGYLFTGDLVYKGKLDIYYEGTDPMKYMYSIEKLLELKIKKIFPGHFYLNVELNIISDIHNALKNIALENKLKHGSGIFCFKSFKICL